MQEINWERKFNSVLKDADTLFKKGNRSLELSDPGLYSMVFVVGNEIAETLGKNYFGDDPNDPDSIRPEAFFEWLKTGFRLDHYEQWEPAQLMAAYAAHLIVDAESVLDDMPEPEKKTYRHGWEWRRDQIIEHCASSIISAMDACQLGQKLLSETIVPDETKLEELKKKYYSDLGKKRAEARHSKPGGSREKRKKIQEIWASGKYTSKTLCAEEEYAALGMSFDTARRALQNEP